MSSRATPRFWAAYRELPAEIRELAQKAYRLFRAKNHKKDEARTMGLAPGQLVNDFDVDARSGAVIIVID